jgi:integrase
MTLTIQSYIAANGERFSLLLDNDNNKLPCFYPTAFIARHIRTTSTHETQKAYLNAIKRLLAWADKSSINIEARILSKRFLSVAELDDLVHTLRLKIRGDKGEVISQIKLNTLLSYVVKYINWLIPELLVDTDSIEVNGYIARLQGVLNAHVSKKTGSRSANAQKVLAKRLSTDMEEVLLYLFANPFKGLLRESDQGSRLRNILMLRILYETGMRRGELLSLKIKSFYESTAGEHPSLVIERNHHDEFDSRVNQPVAKTNGRRLKISYALEEMIKSYLYDYRAKLPRSGLEDEDFIFVNHRLGPKQGDPFSTSSFNSALQDLKRNFKGLDGVHPHLLRHHWNWRYSQLPKADGYTEESDAIDRCYLMGWAHNSQMAKVYNLVHIMEEANAKALMMSMDTSRKNKIA